MKQQASFLTIAGILMLFTWVTSFVLRFSGSFDQGDAMLTRFGNAAEIVPCAILIIVGILSILQVKQIWKYAFVAIVTNEILSITMWLVIEHKLGFRFDYVGQAFSAILPVIVLIFLYAGRNEGLSS